MTNGHRFAAPINWLLYMRQALKRGNVHRGIGKTKRAALSAALRETWCLCDPWIGTEFTRAWQSPMPQRLLRSHRGPPGCKWRQKFPTRHWITSFRLLVLRAKLSYSPRPAKTQLCFICHGRAESCPLVVKAPQRLHKWHSAGFLVGLAIASPGNPTPTCKPPGPPPKIDENVDFRLSNHDNV